MNLEFKRKNLSEAWLYEFQCQDSALLENVLKDVTNSNWASNVGNSSSKNSNFFHKELFDWFDSCIEVAKDDLSLPKQIKLPITICWTNKTNKLQNHHLHSHGNSFMSGIFYLTDSHNGGETVFVCKNPWFQLHKWLSWKNKQENINITYTPKKGVLVLFPSHILHRVNPVKDTSIRYSIAFNTFFAGSIDDSDDYKTKLILSPQTVRDDYK